MFFNLPPLILFLIILSFLVFIHELGHFLAARKFNVKVEEFGLGLPPRAIGKKVGETVYSLNWLPLGGFVKIKGEDYDEHNSSDPRSFFNQKPWKKSVILTAGIFMNILFAIFIFYLTLGLNGFKSSPILLFSAFDFPFGTEVQVNNIVTFISEDSPAASSGMKFGDQIFKASYEGQEISVNSLEDLRKFLSDKADKRVAITTRNINTGEIQTYEIMPEFNSEINQPALGVGLDQAVQLSYEKPFDKFFAGFLHSVNISAYSFKTMGSLIGTSIEEKNVEAVSQGVSGPVGIFGVFKAVLQEGGNETLMILLDFVALISLSLGLMNILPIPALDGGRLVFVLWEGIFGKPISPKFEAKINQMGFGFLIILLVLITYKDLMTFF